MVNWAGSLTPGFPCYRTLQRALQKFKDQHIFAKLYIRTFPIDFNKSGARPIAPSRKEGLTLNFSQSTPVCIVLISSWIRSDFTTSSRYSKLLGTETGNLHNDVVWDTGIFASRHASQSIVGLFLKLPDRYEVCCKLRSYWWI